MDMVLQRQGFTVAVGVAAFKTRPETGLLKDVWAFHYDL